MRRRAGAWLHVDGAFGMWAAASPRLRHLVAGVDRADSWATDAHKWLNVPYDSGLAFCAHPASHRAAIGVRAAYLINSDEGGRRDQMDWTPEFSRRAAASPSTRRCVSWVGAGSPSSSSAAATTRGCSPSS